MPINYKILWLVPACTVVACIVLAIDLYIKNAIIAESVKLREVMENGRGKGPRNGIADIRSDVDGSYSCDNVE